MATNETLVNLFKADDLITRYPGSRYSFNCKDGYAKFELEPGWFHENKEEYIDSDVCGLIIAIWKDCEVRWYEKSRNRGLGANFTTSCRSFDEWQELANKEEVTSMTAKELGKILKKIDWPDNYEAVDEEE